MQPFTYVWWNCCERLVDTVPNCDNCALPLFGTNLNPTIEFGCIFYMPAVEVPDQPVKSCIVIKALYFDMLTWKSAIWPKTFRAHIWGLCKAIIFGPKNIIVWIKSDWINGLCRECSDFFRYFIIYKALLSHPMWK